MTKLDDLLAGVDGGRLVRRFGPEADTWCRGLPGLVAEVAAEQRLLITALLPAGGTSVVLACRTADEQSAILKLTPDPQVAVQEATGLTNWAGCRHVVDLLATDLDRGALLLAAVDPGTTLADDPGGWTLEDVAPVLVELGQAQPVTDLSNLPTLAERIALVFDLARRRVTLHPDVDTRIGDDVWTRSRDASLRLAAEGPRALTHGDLHPGNVLRGGPDRGVVAIDPRPCLGDPASDAVDWAVADVVDEQGLDARIAALARLVPALQPRRVRAWCDALAVVVAASLLARRDDDPVGAFLLDLARTAPGVGDP